MSTTVTVQHCICTGFPFDPPTPSFIIYMYVCIPFLRYCFFGTVSSCILFLQRNGTYILFLKQYVCTYHLFVRRNGTYLVQTKAYEEMVHTYIPFLCTKKWCVCTVSLYKEMVCTYRFFVQRNGTYMYRSKKRYVPLTVCTSYKEKLTKKQYVCTYHFFV